MNRKQHTEKYQKPPLCINQLSQASKNQTLEHILSKLFLYAFYEEMAWNHTCVIYL